ncbi:MAG: hypothetical protein KDA61_11560 [Planctomycetales bacterium]|nr:hypothetical protein [Planctomycetales bacterium]
MAQKPKRFNPFYWLLIPAGIVFVVTAFAYGYMAFQEVNAVRGDATRHASHPLFSWLRVHGNRTLLIELAALAVLTFGYMACDKDPQEPQR